jgi:hypothetical protein
MKLPTLLTKIIILFISFYALYSIYKFIFLLGILFLFPIAFIFGVLISIPIKLLFDINSINYLSSIENNDYNIVLNFLLEVFLYILSITTIYYIYNKYFINSK